MRKEMVIGLVVVAAAIVLLFATTLTPITGNAPSAASETDFFACDDTDGGNERGIKGTATRLNKQTGEERIETDACEGAREQREWYCERGAIKSFISVCDCSDGICT